MEDGADLLDDFLAVPEYKPVVGAVFHGNGDPVGDDPTYVVFAHGLYVVQGNGDGTVLGVEREGFEYQTVARGVQLSSEDMHPPQEIGIVCKKNVVAVVYGGFCRIHFSS